MCIDKVKNNGKHMQRYSYIDKKKKRNSYSVICRVKCQRKVYTGCMLCNVQNYLILPGYLRWRGGEERVFSVCRHQCFCPSPRHLKPYSGSGLGHLGPSPCPYGSLCVCLQNPSSQLALGCASALGTPGSPSHRHSPPCIYYRVRKE